VIVESGRHRALPTSGAGGSATRPRDSDLRTDPRVGVQELERWPNIWGQVNLEGSDSTYGL